LRVVLTAIADGILRLTGGAQKSHERLLTGQEFRTLLDVSQRMSRGLGTSAGSQQLRQAWRSVLSASQRAAMPRAAQGESIARTPAEPSAWDSTGAETLKGLSDPDGAACRCRRNGSGGS
jgi:hypothetical protein